MKKPKAAPPPQRSPRIFLAVLAVIMTAAMFGRGPLTAERVEAQRGTGGLTITKTGPASATPGSVVTYTITATNVSASTATGLNITDGTTGLNGVTLTSTAGNCTVSTGTILCGPFSLGAGNSATVVVTGTVALAAGTVINNTAVVSGTVGGFFTSASATAQTTIVNGGGAQPDLTVAIQAPASVQQGGSIQYNVTVSNQGGTNVTNARTVFNLPAAGTVTLLPPVVASNSFTCVALGQQITCDGGAVSANGTATIVVQGTVPLAAPLGAATATAVVDPNNTIAESNELNNTASAQTQIIAPRGGNGQGLVISKVASAGSVTTGSALSYTVTVTNNSSTAQTGVSVADPAPAGYTVTTAVSTVGSCTLAVNCTIGNLNPGQSAVITINGTASGAAGSTITNIATLTPGGSTAQAVTQITGAAGVDLTVSKQAPATANLGDPINYTITVTNLGNTTANNVRVIDTLPGGVIPSAVSPSPPCVTRATVPQVDCTIPSIAGGASTIITVTVTPTSTGNFTNTADVDPNNTIAETNEANNTATATTNVQSNPNNPPANVLITKVGTPDPVLAGGQLTWTIKVKDLSVGGLQNLKVNDGTHGLDAASVQASFTVSSNPGASSPCAVSASEVVCDLVGSNPGTEFTITIAGTVVAPAGSTINNTAVVSGLDRRIAFSQSATATVEVRPRVDLSVSKSGAPNPATAGGPLVWTITISNSGLDQATGVEFRDTLGAGQIFQSCAAAAFASCTAAGQVVTGTGGTIPSNGSVTVTISVLAPQTGTSTSDTVVVDPANTIAEGDETNNTATATVAITPGADLRIRKCDSAAPDDNPAGSLPVTECAAGGVGAGAGPDPVAPLGDLTYKVVVRNTGTQGAQNVTVVDTLPAQVTFKSAAATNNFVCAHNGVNPGGIVTCTGPQLLNFGGPNPAPQAQTETVITIVVTAPNQVIQLTNTVEVDPNNTVPEVDDNNNKDVELTNVQPTIDLQPYKCDGNPANPPAPFAAGDCAGAGPDPVGPGEALVYRILVRNNGTQNATNVKLVDQLPPGVTFVTAIGDSNFTCLNNAGQISCTGGNVNAGATAIITVTVNVNNNVANNTNLANQVVVDPDKVITESDETNNEFISNTLVQAKVNLTVDKDTSPAGPLAPNGRFTYNIRARNLGTAPATAVELKDALPAGVVVQNLIVPAASGFLCQTFVNPDNVVSCSNGTIAAGGTVIIQIEALAPTVPGPYQNQVSIDPDNKIVETNEGDNTFTWTILVQVGGGGNVIDLSPTQIQQLVPAVGPVGPGQQYQALVQITNTGSDTAFNVRVRITLQAGSTYDFANGDPPGPAEFACGQVSPSIIDCIVGAIPGGGAKFIRVAAIAPRCADCGTGFEVAVDPQNQINEGNEGNNSNLFAIQVQATADLTITKTASAATVSPGSTFTYNLAINVTGTGTVGPVEVSDAMPLGVTIQNIAPQGVNPFGCVIQPGQVVFCSAPSITAPAGPFNIVITVQVNAANGSALVNTAFIDPANKVIETNENNNQSSVTVNVQSTLDLNILKDTPNTVTVATGNEFNYRLRVSATGAGTANNVVVRDPLPIGVQVLSITQSAGTTAFICELQQQGQGTNIVVCTAPVMTAPSANNEILIRVRVTALLATVLVNTAQVDPGNTVAETDEGNNLATVATQVVGGDLTVFIVGGAGPFASGSTIQLEYQWVNTTGTNHPAVKMEANLPPGVILTNITVATQNINCQINNAAPTQQVVCTASMLDNTAAVVQLSLFITAPAGTLMTTTAQVDPQNQIVEINELNNNFAFPILVN